MILLLVSPEEKHSLSPDILKEPVLIYTSPSILTNLYKDGYENELIITRRFANLAGNEGVIDAIKSLNLVLPLGELKVTYFNHYNIEDNVSVELYKIGCKVLNQDIKDMTLDTFLDLRYTRATEVVGIKEEEVTGAMLSLIEDIENTDKESLRLFTDVNYERITNSLLNFKGVVENLEGIKGDNKTLSHELQNSLKSEELMVNELIETNFLYQDLKSRYDTLLKYMMVYGESIESYNRRINETVIGEEYIVKIENTNTLVLYFKEVEDIGFLRFFNSLVDYLSLVKNYNTKAVILENSNRSSYYTPYKGYNTVSTFSTTADAINSDKIVRYGNASNLIELLMRKQFMLQVLVVLDRTGNDTPVVESPNQFVYYLGRRRRNYPALNIQDENFISPHEGMWTSVDHVLGKADNLGNIPYDIHAKRHPLMVNIIKLVDDYIYNNFS